MRLLCAALCLLSAAATAPAGAASAAGHLMLAEAGDPARRALMLGRIPLGRFGTAEEMGAAIRYLASPAASYITGQVLLLDGGLTAG